jgi:hypothetical protein
MNDEQKHRFDAIATLRSWAWASFDRRREFEWKVSMGVWTALAALIGILLTQDAPFQVPAIKWGSIFFVIFLLCLHAVYSQGVATALKLDRDKALLYEELLDKEFGPFLTEELRDRGRKRLSRIVLFNYSNGFQLGVTLLLSGCLIMVIFSK